MSFDDQAIPVRCESIDSNRSQSRSSSPPAALQTEYYQQLEHIFGAIDPKTEESKDEVPADTGRLAEHTEDIEAYEFRLFARPLKESSGEHRPSTHQVTLRSPTPINCEPGFLIARRPDSYYFTSTLDEALAVQFNVAAISGDEVVKQSKTRWQGSELPWKVTVISSKNVPVKTSDSIGTTANESRTGRKRSGKKRRIAIRKKLRLKVAQDLALKQSRAEKEVAEKEKRTRRNREKKVKKKQKEKLKKAELAQDSAS